MLPKSIRWRLPLSYASIALLATIALGAVLLTTLRGYYAMREHDNLQNNATLISDVVSRMYDRDLPQPLIGSVINAAGFVTQSRVQLYDPQNNLIADSGNPFEKRVIALNADGAPPDASAIFINGLPDAHYITQPGADSDSTSGGFWIAGQQSDSSSETAPAPPNPYMFSVSGSPYGVGLRREFSADSHSDQSVQLPVYDANQTLLGSITVSNGPAYGTEIIDGMTWALIGAGAAAVVLAAVVGWFMSRTITAPLLVLSRATAQMANGELSTRISTNRADEFGVLAHSFDEMAQRVEATVIALRRFVADAAHQIHTPLTAVHADLELAASEPDHERQQMFIERAFAQLKRIEALTNDLLDLSRLEAHAVDDRRALVDLVALVSELSEQFASRAEQAGINFNVDASDQPVRATINETQFRHAIGNLLDNAIKFTPENGTITVGVRRDGDQAELWVNDTGIGISEEDLPQLFNRFHRGRNAAAYPGSGLGLAIIKAIVEGHHGEISVRSKAGDGTHFEVRVPAGA